MQVKQWMQRKGCGCVEPGQFRNDLQACSLLYSTTITATTTTTTNTTTTTTTTTTPTTTDDDDAYEYDFCYYRIADTSTATVTTSHLLLPFLKKRGDTMGGSYLVFARGAFGTRIRRFPISRCGELGKKQHSFRSPAVSHASGTSSGDAEFILNFRTLSLSTLRTRILGRFCSEMVLL